MAEEKDNQEEEKPPKRKLTSLIGVAVGAVLGGSGVVMFTPAQEPEPKPKEAVSQEAIEWLPADVELDFRFNPQTDRGKAFGQVSFKVGFIVQPGKLPEAKASVTKRLSQARSRCLELLSGQTVRELTSVEGKKHLKRLLMDELTYSLFPATKGERIATVENIFWTNFLIQ